MTNAVQQSWSKAQNCLLHSNCFILIIVNEQEYYEEEDGLLRQNEIGYWEQASVVSTNAFAHVSTTLKGAGAQALIILREEKTGKLLWKRPNDFLSLSKLC